MKHIIKYILVVIAVINLNSCEYFKPAETTLNVQTGEIKFPAMTLNGEPLMTMEVGTGTYVEPGASASLGADDISEDVIITGSVDSNTPGIYAINYFVETLNSLGQTSAASVNRLVLVTSEDVTNIDLSGNYQGSGFGTNIEAITRVAPGWYTINDVLASNNGISATWGHLGGNVIQIPDQPGPFGNVNTTAAGADATLTATGFTWNVFIGCCGVFGPITFVKQ